MSKVILGAVFAAFMFVSPISSAEDMKPATDVQQADMKVDAAKTEAKDANKAADKAQDKMMKAQDDAEKAAKDAAAK